MQENWKTVSPELLNTCTWSYPPTRNQDLYEVSDQGRIRNTKTRRVLKPIPHKGNRKLRVFLAVQAGGGHLEFQISHLVYGAFHPEALKHDRLLNAVIGHKNGDSTDNRLENLELRFNRVY